MTKAVIFDYGGVFIDITDTFSAGLIMESMGLPDESLDLINKLTFDLSAGIINEQIYWEELAHKTGKKIPENWHELLRKPLRDNMKLYEPSVKLVKKIRDRGIKAIVLSNTIPPHPEVIKPLGWYDYFDRLYFSCDIGFVKPDKKAYEYVLNKENLKAEECVFVDDREENTKAAQQLGMKTVWLQDPTLIEKSVEEILWQ